MVDGVLLACDTSEKKHTGSTKKGSVADAVRQVNGQRQNKTTRSSCQPSQSSTLNGITDKVNDRLLSLISKLIIILLIIMIFICSYFYHS